MEQLESSAVSKSLLTEMTTLGVDDWLFVVNVEILFLMGGALRIYSWLFVAVFLHFVLMLVTRMVPNVLMVYAAHLRQASKYFAGFSPIQKRGLRPIKFGLGEQL